jgi:hypothetical protein
MLNKMIDLGSQPYGLAVAGEDIPKGSAVVIVADATKPNGVKAMLPSTEAQAKAVKGFATFRIENEEGADTAYEVIKAGKWVVVYTLVKDNMWRTTVFVAHADVKADASLVVGYGETDAGKLRLLTADEISASRPAQFNVFGKNDAGAGYTKATVEVTVL